ncbi:MAG: prolipoprotein diacylglyceryl transferase [Cyanobacteriota bacterium]
MVSLLAGQFQSPGPILWQFGPLALRWYGLLIASAFLLGCVLAQNLAQRRRIDPGLISELAIWLLLTAIPAARLYYVLFEWPRYAAHPWHALAIWQGGIAIHGALIGGTLAAWVFVRCHRLSFWNLLDVLTPAVILGQAIGRWGNFFNSEAFGAPTDLPWKLYIPLDYRPWAYRQFEYFHPTFLYESLWNLGVFGILMTVFFYGLRHPQRVKVGAVTGLYLLLYSAGRVWIEGLRMDSLMLGPLRMAQLVSLTLMLLGSAILFWLYRTGRPLPDLYPAPTYE